MHILVKAVFPPNKSEEVGKAYLKFISKGMPKGVRLLESYVVVTQEGVEGYSIYRVKDENFVEGFKGLQESYVAYHEIEGYRYKIENALTAVEALPMVGLKPPE